MSLAAQKFIAGISHDSLQIYKQRRKQTLARLKDQGLKDQKATLFTEDLAEALQEVCLDPDQAFPQENVRRVNVSHSAKSEGRTIQRHLFCKCSSPLTP